MKKDIAKRFTNRVLVTEPNLDNGIKPYVEVGAGLSAADGVEVFDGDRFTVAEVGASIPITESFSAKAKFEHKWGEDDARDWKFEVGTKYKF